MTNIGTPNNIDVLLHCHTSPMPHERLEAGAVQSAIAELLSMGAIKPWPEFGENAYTTTEMGAAWVKALCNVRPPRSVFVDEAGRILET